MVNMDPSKKMLNIAGQLQELKNGKVKCFRGNDKGHAKVKEITPGCALWVHHLPDDKIIIDLMVSDKAMDDKPYDCKRNVETFKSIFESWEHTNWFHSIDKTHYDRYFIDVTDLKFNQILGLARKASSKLY